MDDKIIERCKNGDLEAFRQLYDYYGQPLLRTAMRILENRQDSEDAVQMTFIRLHRSVGRFEGRSQFSSYLFRILFNVCYDVLKKRKRMKMIPLENTNLSREMDPEGAMVLDQAINGLPPQMKTCFTLFAIEGMKQEEIAEILDLSIGGVKSNIFHARRKLRAVLTEDGVLPR